MVTCSFFLFSILPLLLNIWIYTTCYAVTFRYLYLKIMYFELKESIKSGTSQLIKLSYIFPSTILHDSFSRNSKNIKLAKTNICIRPARSGAVSKTRRCPKPRACLCKLTYLIAYHVSWKNAIRDKKKGKRPRVLMGIPNWTPHRWRAVFQIAQNIHC